MIEGEPWKWFGRLSNRSRPRVFNITSPLIQMRVIAEILQDWGDVAGSKSHNLRLTRTATLNSAA